MDTLKLFSTREIATGIWLIVLFLFIFISPKIRNHGINVIKAVCNKQLLIPFFILMFYTIFLIYIFSLTTIWEKYYIKDIVIWAVFIGIPIFFDAIDRKRKNDYFKNILINNLKLTFVIEFFISTFTFNIIMELLMIPVFFIVGGMQALSVVDDKYKFLRNFFSKLISILGLIILVFTIKNAIQSYAELGKIELIVRFCIPIIFSILYLPLAYMFSIFADYQILFLRMRSKGSKNIKVDKKCKWMVIKECKLSCKYIRKFGEDFIRRMYFGMGEKEFNDLIIEFRKEKLSKR